MADSPHPAVKLGDVLFKLWSASSVHERNDVLIEAAASLQAARPVVEKLIARVPFSKQQKDGDKEQQLACTFVHQFAVMSLLVEVGNDSEKLHRSSNNSRSNGNRNASANDAGPIFSEQQAQSLLACAQQCRNLVGWARASCRSASAAAPKPASHSSPPGNNNAAAAPPPALCVATQVELLAATAAWSMRNFPAAYESYRVARSNLCDMLHATFPQHNGNPPAYVLYFLTVSLAAVYHNLAVVAKQLQRYDAALLWMLHFVRIAALVRRDASPELEELKEPLCTRAGLARQFVLPVLAGIVSQQTPYELVSRIQAVVDSGKNSENRWRVAAAAAAAAANGVDKSGAKQTADRDASRSTASRLAAVQSFSERFFAGAALEAVLRSSAASSSAPLFLQPLTTQQARCSRVDATELFFAVSPGDTADEISARLSALSFPRVGATTRVGSSAVTPTATTVSTASFFAIYPDSQQICEQVAASAASAATAGAVTSCDAMAISSAAADGDFDLQSLSPEVRHLLFAGIDFSSVGGEHSAMAALLRFYMSERSEIGEAISSDLKLLAVALNPDSWLDPAGSDGNGDDGGSQFASATVVLDFESALEVFCGEFDVLLSPLCLDAVRANAIGLYDIGGVSLHLGHEQREAPSTAAAAPVALPVKSDSSTGHRVYTYTPKVIGSSGLLSNERLRAALNHNLPMHVQNFDWTCRFSSRTHGSSFSKLFSQCAGYSPLLLVVLAVHASTNISSSAGAPPPPPHGDDSASEKLKFFTFGAFIGGALEPAPSSSPNGGAPLAASPMMTRVSSHRSSNFGETFVFREVASSASPQGLELQCFHPVEGTNRSFVECNAERIQIGASGTDSAATHGAAIYLPAWLRAGSSYPCDTFGSPPLMENLDSSFSFKPCAVEVWSIG